MAGCTVYSKLHLKLKKKIKKLSIIHTIQKTLGLDRYLFLLEECISKCILKFFLLHGRGSIEMVSDIWKFIFRWKNCRNANLFL